MRITTTNNYSAIAALDYLQNHTNIIIGIGNIATDGSTTSTDTAELELTGLVGYINPTSIHLVYEDPLGNELIQGVRYSIVNTINYNRAYLSTYKCKTILLKVLIQHADLLSLNSSLNSINLIGVYSDATIASTSVGDNPIKTTKTGGNLDFIIKTQLIKMVDGTDTGINVIINF